MTGIRDQGLSGTDPIPTISELLLLHVTVSTVKRYWYNARNTPLYGGYYIGFYSIKSRTAIVSGGLRPQLKLFFNAGAEF